MFGDSEPDDALDASAPDADPEQVAIRWHEIGAQIAATRGEARPHWPELTPEQREDLVEGVVRVRVWLRDQGARL